MLDAKAKRDKPLDGDAGTATACAGILLAALECRPKTWAELSDAGLSRRDVVQAVADLVQCGRHRFIIGPLMVQIESEGDA